MLLSLDVGFSKCGWAVYKHRQPVACGCIITEKSKKKQTRVSDDYAYRSAMIAQGLQQIVGHYGSGGIVGELPSGGAQSAKAMVQMGMATASVASAASIMGLPVEWTSPSDVKLAVTGSRKATKEEIMDAIATKYDWEKMVKGNRTSYIVLGDKITKGVFEHIADACGAYLALIHGNLAKMFG
ncbi:crossover junction endodeoxyribonuclease RuvC [Neptuniibacter sp.]|uniref:crossover junction endodeoxyribonuclease RuvC n=1 Tax=Neptuniibacter sp. TaxID=1962643 RepID=UPI002629DB46|nr:crossover junction endodeoxyribonuclease RuvC [Neptuniibacter sp.]MCP4597027.1 crossover junction endodeoxyribonuclease RuvC [Neptuniibacter sp.]